MHNINVKYSHRRRRNLPGFKLGELIEVLNSTSESPNQDDIVAFLNAFVRS